MRSMKIVVLSIVLSLVLAAGVSAQTTITYSAGAMSWSLRSSGL